MDLMKKFEVEQAVKEFENNEQMLPELYKMLAKDLKIFFEQLKEQGFTDYQALILTCERVIKPQ